MISSDSRSLAKITASRDSSVQVVSIHIPSEYTASKMHLVKNTSTFRWCLQPHLGWLLHNLFCYNLCEHILSRMGNGKSSLPTPHSTQMQALNSSTLCCFTWCHRLACLAPCFASLCCYKLYSCGTATASLQRRNTSSSSLSSHFPISHYNYLSSASTLDCYY